MSRRQLVMLASLAFILGFGPLVSRADKVYWTVFEAPEIRRANLDGSGVELLLDETAGLSQPISISLHVDGGKMYFTNAGDATIRRADLDGESPEQVITGLGLLSGIAVDAHNEMVYWCDFGTGKIQRANLNGTGIEDLVTSGLVKPQSIALDVAGDKMYWTDTDAHRIQRANLDGSGVEELVAGLGSLSGIALDVPAGKMYWCNWTDGVIHRANMEIPDGETPTSRTDIEDIVTGLAYPNGIALDLVHSMIYWSDTDTAKIERATLDGQDLQDIVTVDGLPMGVALEVSLAPVPTVSAWGLAVMTLLAIAVGSLVFTRRRAA